MTQEIYKHYQQYYLEKYNFEENKELYLKGENLIIGLDSKINPPPFHYLVESATLGAILEIIKSLHIFGTPVSEIICNEFDFDNPTTFIKYLNRIREVRNRAAHNERMFNRNYIAVKNMPDYRQLLRTNLNITIYEHKLLNTYFTVCRLLHSANKFRDLDELIKHFKLEMLENSDKKVEDLQCFFE